MNRREQRDIDEREQGAREDDAALLASDRRRRRRPVFGENEPWESPRAFKGRTGSYAGDYGTGYGDGGYADSGSAYGGDGDYNPAITQPYQQRGRGHNTARYDHPAGGGYPEYQGYGAGGRGYGQPDEEEEYGVRPARDAGTSLKSWVSEAADTGGGNGFFSERTFESAGATGEMVEALRAVGAETPSHVQALGYRKVRLPL